LPAAARRIPGQQNASPKIPRSADPLLRSPRLDKTEPHGGPELRRVIACQCAYSSAYQRAAAVRGALRASPRASPAPRHEQIRARPPPDNQIPLSTAGRCVRRTGFGLRRSLLFCRPVRVRGRLSSLQRRPRRSRNWSDAVGLSWLRSVTIVQCTDPSERFIAARGLSRPRPPPNDTLPARSRAALCIPVGSRRRRHPLPARKTFLMRLDPGGR
jgi:hypothetical protein